MKRKRVILKIFLKISKGKREDAYAMLELKTIMKSDISTEVNRSHFYHYYPKHYHNYPNLVRSYFRAHLISNNFWL